MVRYTGTLLCLCLYLTPVGYGFDIPNEAARAKAVGNISTLPAKKQRFYLPLDNFIPKRPPSKDDWLALHTERPQSFVRFIKQGNNQPSASRKTMYLAPLATPSEAQAKRIESIRALANIYFGLTVKVLPAGPLPEAKIRSRLNPTLLNKQYHAGDILDHLKEIIPKDAFCLLGISPQGLYPDPRWNFVFGLASLKERVGVYSFVRLDPTMYGKKPSAENTTTLRRRATKLVIHEAGHTFGLEHCVYYECVMNGSNHLNESDSRPFHLCPICLRKLEYSVGFNLEQRYKKLATYYKDHDDKAQHAWVIKRLNSISGVK